MPPLRRAFEAGGNHFSFATPITRKSHGPGAEGVTERAVWIQKVRGTHGYVTRPGDLKPGARARGMARAPGDFSVLDGEDLMGLALREDDHWPGGASPTLWENAAAAAAAAAASPKARLTRLIPVHPGPQAQVMVKYRQEMMELVRDVPESAYELSLRDLVEIPRMARSDEEEAGKERGAAAPEIVTGRDRKNEKKTKKGKKQILRSTSMDSGVFLLKMFFPASLGGRRASGGSGSGSKVSPKPVLPDLEKGRPEKGVDTDCSEGSSEMGSSSGRRRKLIGCSPFSISKGRIRWPIGKIPEQP